MATSEGLDEAAERGWERINGLVRELRAKADAPRQEARTADYRQLDSLYGAAMQVDADADAVNAALAQSEATESDLRAARQRIAEVEDALREISDPIAHAVAIAEATGRVVDGDAAVQLSRDANYLRELARLALGSNADAEREAFRRSQAVSAKTTRCVMEQIEKHAEAAPPLCENCGRDGPDVRPDDGEGPRPLLCEFCRWGGRTA